VSALLLALAACYVSSRVAILAQPAPSPLLELRNRIDTLLADAPLRHTSWGILVRSLKVDETLYAKNADKLMMPASDMKIVTLAVAADRLGWDYAYETRVLATGPVNADMLEGDLLVVGSGDPSMGPIGGSGSNNGVFEAWAERLKAAGIHAVRGRIVGDDRAFDGDTLGPGWAWDDLADGYAAGVGALQYAENIVWLTINPAARLGGPAEASLSSTEGGLEIHSDVKTSAAGLPPSLVARRLPGSSRLDLRGSVPLGGPVVVRSLAVDRPTLFFVNSLRATLIAQGIDVRGPAVDIDDLASPPSPENVTLLFSHRSPPLSTLALRMMKMSRNTYAETLLKTLGATAGAAGTAAGRDAVNATVQSWGLAPGAVGMVDGSGLSRYNLITPAALVAILTHADRDERLRTAFQAALPIGGRDGTLEHRMKDTAAQNNVRAKTGAFASARALSGYVRTADNEPLVFSILANNFETPGDVIERAVDAIVVRLAEFRR
jgi:D-alanyl-D-alanine carboxypeptidase/D-alanyl-D-alanine-endopeptidase (penicillin-binding protein 4)